ncbi:hypothetical protein F2Q69_00047620 [Brassica cretica]|uniref:Uncharacterized protein n=1 Tax=Brassica cretica TaxID=69181 RepID=A0A8S9Q3P5_BRACR|nr:hypothetical protein F2Q69_00047620 [Brassica cretica]
MAVVQSFQSETPTTLEAEEARLSGCKGELAVVDGDFDLILADLKSACFLPTCSEGPEGKDPVLGEGRGDAAPGLDEATGEEGADRAEHAFGRCVATLFELLSDVSCFLRKAFRMDESISKKYLSKKCALVIHLLHTFPSSNLQDLSSSKSFAFNMSSSHGDKRSSDVEMGEATSPAPIPTSPVGAPPCVADRLSFQERLVRRQAEKEQVQAGSEFPSSSALAVAPGHGTEGVTP